MGLPDSRSDHRRLLRHTTTHSRRIMPHRYIRHSPVQPSHALSVSKIGKAKDVYRCRYADVYCEFTHQLVRVYSTRELKEASCVSCLSSGWTLAITEGSLENVYCPSVTCTKSRATKEGKFEGLETGVDAELVESVVGPALRQRWEWIKENRKVETGKYHGCNMDVRIQLIQLDPTYTICPQPGCQKPVPPPAPPTEAEKLAQEAISKHGIRLSDINKLNTLPTATQTPPTTDPPAGKTPAVVTEDRWDRYRLCPSCSFSFCLYCSATWHGPHTPCAFSKASAIVQEYLSFPEGSEERSRMESRRGKSNIERMVAKWREDEENKKWLEEKTRACSGCGVRVEKRSVCNQALDLDTMLMWSSHGCNHMTCGRCGAHFCYRCEVSVSPLALHCTSVVS